MAIDIVLRVDEKKGIVAVENFGRRSTRALRRTEKEGTKSMNRMATNGTKALKTLAGAFVGIFAARQFVRGMRSAISATADFQKGIAEIKTLGIQKSIREIGSEVDALTREFGLDSQSTIKAYYDAISAGIKEANIGQFMREASRLAIAGATDISTATDLLTTLSNVYRDETVPALAAYANEAKNLGKLTIPELSGAIGTVAATAKTAGASVQELFAATVSLTKQGINTELAMTGLRALFASIVKPAKEVEKVAEGVGLEFSISALRTKGLAQFLGELVPKLEGNDKLITQLFGNIRAFNAVAAIASENAKDFGEALEKIEGEAALANLEAGFKTMQETAAFTFAQLRAEWETLQRRTGAYITEGLLPAAKNSRLLLEAMREDTTGFFGAASQTFSNMANLVSAAFKATGGVVLTVFESVFRLYDVFVRGTIKALNLIPGVAIDVSNVVTETLAGMAESAANAADVNFKAAGESISALGVVALETAPVVRQSLESLIEPAKTVKKTVKEIGDGIGDLKIIATDTGAVFGPLQLGEEELLKVREGIANAKNELIALGAAFELAEEPGEEGLLARQILAGLEPDIIGPQIAERLGAIFEEMDPEELRENIPTLIDLMTAEDPAEEAKKFIDNLTEPLDLGIEGLQMRLQGAANIFGGMVKLFGQASSAGALFAKAAAASDAILAIIKGKLAIAEGAVRIARGTPYDPPLAASGVAMKVAGISQIATGVVSLARAATIGQAQEGGLFERPALSTFAERGPEVALPLEDERTTAALSGAFGKAFEEGAPGGGATIIVNGVFATEDQTYRAVARGLREARDVDVGVT